MITAFIISYGLLSIMLLVLQRKIEFEKFDRVFIYTIIIIFFIPLVIEHFWLYNWDCDSNDIEYDNRNNITIKKPEIW